MSEFTDTEDRTDRLMIAFSSGITGGIVGAILAIVGMQIVGHLVMRGAKQQQAHQFQERYR